jgi:hypothetical protein
MSQANRPYPFAPHGALDGIVCDTKLAKNMSFVARYGNSCGIPFKKDEYFKKHRQWAKFQPYVNDRLTQPWTEFSINKQDTTKTPKTSKKTKKNKGIKGNQTKPLKHK